MPLTPSEKKTLILQGASDISPEVVAVHIRSLDSDYFNEFTPEEILGHLRILSVLVKYGGFSFDLVPMGDRSCGLTVIGEDLPGFFAALSGLLASYDFDIRLGKVFSYAAENIGTENRKASVIGSSGIGSGKIIDYLVLDHPSPGFLTPAFRSGLTVEFGKLVELLRARKTQELRKDLYRRIGEYLSRNAAGLETPRLPVEIQVEFEDRQTVLIVRGSDRKALLFSLSNALMLQGVSIQKLLTKSEGDHFEDRLYITDAAGRAITDIRNLERLKVAIVLMERFTSTLPQASDYPAAVESFNGFIDALMEKSGGRPDLPAFEDFSTLSTLAKILSAGPYLWEELIKLPLPDLTDLLRKLEEEKKSRSRTELESLLRDELEKASDHEGKAALLNRFKDYQLFRLDVLYLVYPHKTLQEFSGELSDLAEVILEAALWLAYDRLRAEYGEPQGDTSLPEKSGKSGKSGPCHFGLFAQGKLGGRELGYASDLELQLLYGNTGETSGTDRPISHSEFFSLLVQEVRRVILARTDGIFELDLRLRPHGDSGPLASRVDTWVEYYGEDGGALDFERQALLKLRPVAATPGFADRVMAARDALVFGEIRIGIENTLALRAKQVELKTGSGKTGAAGLINAKYSTGGLVEVEYSVQFLQLMHGRRISALREPNTEKALEVLLAAGILPPSEFERLYKGYVFLRRLINALRMVRGHSRDLFVPARGTAEFLHLAKRMGYLATERFEPDSQLDWDLRHTLKDVHALFARRFLGSPEPESDAPSLTAVLLDPEATAERMREALARLGLGEVPNAENLIRKLFAAVNEKGLMCAALVVAETKLRASPDPEAVLRHLGQFLEMAPDADYFVRQILNHPHLQEILIKAFGHSEYLTQILLQQPEYLIALGNPRALEKPKLLAEFRKEAMEIAGGKDGLEPAMEGLRRYRNREYLRIGLRDIFLGEHLRKITAEISHLSTALIESAFNLTMTAAGTGEWRDGISVIALGKLGGNELNYSSDIDIVFVFDPDRISPEGQIALEAWARAFIAVLSQSGSHGKMFRVDTQLRPYGSHSPLLSSLAHYAEYFTQAAAGWELQSWLKARPLAGNADMGLALTRRVQALAVSPRNREKIETSMRKVRQLGLDKLRQEDRLSTEVKLGPGGIRTIEFYVQYLQIQHGEDLPELISGNTLAVLGRLFRYRLISHNYFELLTKSYVFLRRIEHVLQLQGLQQRHELPSSAVELEKLAKRMGFDERIGQSASSQFRTRYRQHMLTLLELSSSLFGYETNIPGTSQDQEAR